MERVMYWLVLIGSLCLFGDTPSSQNIHQIRQSLNRFDELDIVILKARAKEDAKLMRQIPNDERRFRLKICMVQFAEKSLHISLPLQPAEAALIENVASEAATPFDFLPAFKSIGVTKNPYSDLGWYHVFVNGRYLLVRGVKSPTDMTRIDWKLEDQPPEVIQQYNAIIQTKPQLVPMSSQPFCPT